MASTTGLEALYGPTPVPGELGTTTASQTTPMNMIGSAGFTPEQQAMMQQTSGGGVDFTKSGVIDQGVAYSRDLATYDPSEGSSAWYSEGEVDPKKYEAFIPEVPELGEEETEEFIEADKVGGKKHARAAKRADRKADREKRKELGLRGPEKRARRKAQRRARKQAWRSYKGEKELDEMEAAYASETGGAYV